MKDFARFVIVLTIALAVFFGLAMSFKAFQVFDISMEPTYKSGDYIVVNKLAYVSNSPTRGSVIALYSPENSEQLSVNPFSTEYSSLYIKRVIAVGGDTVEIKNQQVYVNGILTDEPYIMEPCSYSYTTSVPYGEYFVLGDNRNHSYDSHSGWLVPQQDVVGSVCVCYWHADYPDIHIIFVPAALFIVLIFSKDAIDGVVKKGTGKTI